ncbi:MAG TPA: urease accessory protein UreD [Nitrospirales bacterium]|nr:urease accessory protein UreD [Nitrospirales bacterium]
MSDVMTIVPPENDTATDESPRPQWSHIKVAVFRGSSGVVSCRNVQPLKILNPRNLSDCSQAYLSSYGGGFVTGDDIRLKIECESGSKFFLGTQSDTKIYKSVGGRIARQHICGHLSDNATAVILPDALIPFADSRFAQTQEWHLTSSSNLLLVDWIHSGRLGYGECFDFDFLRSEISISVDGKKRVADRMQLEPAKDHLRAIGGFGAYRSILNVYIVGEALRNALRDSVLFRSQLDEKSGTWVIANPVREDTLIVRVMSKKKETISDYVKGISSALAGNDILGFDPYKRKY